MLSRLALLFLFLPQAWRHLHDNPDHRDADNIAFFYALIIAHLYSRNITETLLATVVILPPM